jgi:hypothetical protein
MQEFGIETGYDLDDKVAIKEWCLLGCYAVWLL